MASAYPSEATVVFSDYQQLTSVDLNDAATNTQASLDNVVAAFLSAGQGYTGLSVSANSDALGVTVNPGLLYNIGGGFPLRAAQPIDLTPQINLIPDAVSSQIVLIVANSGAALIEETRTLEDASRKPTNPADLWATVQKAITTRNVRAATPSIVPGVVSATNVQAPAYNPLLCLLATVTLNKTGVVSVVQNTAARITRVDQLVPVVTAQGAQLATYQSAIAGLLSSVSGLALALAQLRKDTAAQIAALQAAITALAAQQVTAAAPGSVFSQVDTFTDASGLTVSASAGASVGSGLTFPQGPKNPISYFPLMEFASNLKVLTNHRYLTAPFTEVADGGNGLITSTYANVPGPIPTGQYITNQLGPWNVTPKVEGFAVQRSRFGGSLAVQSAATIQSSSDPSQLFGSSSYALAYDPTWAPWASYSPEISHQNGLWRDLAARGLWGPRTASAPTGNLVAVSQVFQTDTDDMVTSFRFYKAGVTLANAGQPPARLLICEELNGAPDPNNVILDITGYQINSNNPGWNGFYSDQFNFPYPVLRKAGRRYHFVIVYTASTVGISTTAKSYTPDPSMKTFMVRNANGGWSQDPNNDQLTCSYTRANFTQGATPVELNSVSLDGGIDNLDILTPIVMPTGCDVFYGTFSSGGAYSRLAPINPTDPTSNPLAGRPSYLRIAVEIIPTGRTAPIIDMAPTAIGTTVSTAARRAGTLTAQSAVRAPVNTAGAPISVTKITQVVMLQNFNPALHTFTETLGTGASYGTPNNPTAVSGPVTQSDGTVQFTFSWTLTSGVTTFVANYNGTTTDVTQTFTMTKSITTAAP